ncbi:Uncharacterised protein [Vibrio cholerae]|nr:Uncharacterised protein [Vibrio cholerae]
MRSAEANSASEVFNVLLSDAKVSSIGNPLSFLSNSVTCFCTSANPPCLVGNRGYPSKCFKPSIFSSG